MNTYKINDKFFIKYLVAYRIIIFIKYFRNDFYNISIIHVIYR